ncbi:MULTISPECIES: LacI family DNA-binding transcriptional regulator [Microbacterium]|uniref:LacI family DNA-binding transcriptional regulator n=1 Tax=Microbacterium TaxID=33882 RepID=UPI0022F03E19|nr:LacI family DNA-binding transcriptional regulator [Streptomyces sp. MS2A]
MSVTLADVAKAAGLSGSTVSRALSAPEKVNAQTRERVRRIAEEMGYVPNHTARSLTSGRTDILGLIVPDIGNPFFPPIIKAVQARAQAKGRTVLIADTDERPADEPVRAGEMRARVDGLIVVSPRSDGATLAQLASLGPAVFVNRVVPDQTSIVIDAGDGMRQAVEHLAALGHRTIAYLNGPRRSWSNQQREKAVADAAAAFGLTMREYGPFEPQVQSGVHAADLVLASDVTGVIAYDDLIALGVMARLNERHVTVGRDLSIIGVDDSPMSSMAYPTLTTVAVPGMQAGSAAVDALVRRLDSPDADAETITLETRLTVRSSTGLAPRPE